MGNPQLLAVETELLITSTNISNNPPIRIKFHQQNTGRLHYRLYCKASSLTPSNFQPFYIYLNDQETSPSYIYALNFLSTRVTNTSGTTQRFVEDVFSRYPDTDVLVPSVELQSSSGDFTTYDASTESRTLTIRLKENTFGPTWTSPTWVDTTYSSNPGVAALTGSDQKGVQGVSTIRFNISKATVWTGSAVDYYSVSFPGYPAIKIPSTNVPSSGLALQVSLNSYSKLVGTIPVEFSVTDMRGQTTKYTQNLTLVPYSDISITTNNTHRKNGTGSTVVLDFSGKWNGAAGSPAIALSCTSIVAKDGSTTIATLTPTITVSGTTFSYHYEWSGVTFDSSKAYKITITLTDTVKTVARTIDIPVGTPVISVRDGKVGINESVPDCALDVTGDIHANGFQVFYHHGAVPNLDINECTKAGTYSQTATRIEQYSNLPNISISTGYSCPVLVEVTGTQANLVQKLYSLSTDEMFIRIRSSNSYRSWKKVTLT